MLKPQTSITHPIRMIVIDGPLVIVANSEQSRICHLFDRGLLAESEAWNLLVATGMNELTARILLFT